MNANAMRLIESTGGKLGAIQWLEVGIAGFFTAVGDARPRSAHGEGTERHAAKDTSNG
jgi:hypothetical protein